MAIQTVPETSSIKHTIEYLIGLYLGGIDFHSIAEDDLSIGDMVDDYGLSGTDAETIFEEVNNITDSFLGGELCDSLHRFIIQHGNEGLTFEKFVNTDEVLFN